MKTMAVKSIHYAVGLSPPSCALTMVAWELEKGTALRLRSWR